MNEYYMKAARIRLNEKRLTNKQELLVFSKAIQITNDVTEMKFGYGEPSNSEYVDYVLSSNSLFELIQFNSNILEMFRKISKNNFDVIKHKTYRIDKNGIRHEVN